MANTTLVKRLVQYFVVFIAVAIVTWIYVNLREEVNAITISLSYLLVVLIMSLTYGMSAGILASIAGTLCFNFFFLPPFGTFHIEDPLNWIALGTFLIVAVVVSHLSSAVKSRALDAETQRDRASKLYALSRNIIATPESEINVTTIANLIFGIYKPDFFSLHVPDEGGKWQHVTLKAEKLQVALPDLAERLQEGTLHPTTLHELVVEQSVGVLYSTIEIGGRPLGVLAMRGPNLDKETVDATAGVVALALERARYLSKSQINLG
jgi:two-component system sensor histidine kinase KdpD